MRKGIDETVETISNLQIQQHANRFARLLDEVEVPGFRPFEAICDHPDNELENSLAYSDTSNRQVGPTDVRR